MSGADRSLGFLRQGIFFLFVFGVYAALINTYNIKSFGLQHIGINALVHDGHYYIENATLPELPYPTADVFTHEGHLYPAKQPGQFLIGALAYYPIYKSGITYQNDYYLAGALVTLLTSALMTALASVLVLNVLFAITQNALWSALGAIFFSFGTLAFAYSGVVHHDVYATFFAFLSFYLLFRAREAKGRASLRILAGLLLGFTFFISMLPQAILVTTFLYALLTSTRRGLAVFAGSFAAGLLPMFIFNWAAFGGPLNLPQFICDCNEAVPTLSLDIILNNLYFYLLSPANAVFFYTPIYLVALMGFAFMPREHRAEKTTLFLAFFLTLVHLSTIFAVGGAQFGPRYMLTTMPYVLLGLSGYFTGGGSWEAKIRPIVILVGVVSIMLSGSGAAMGAMYGRLSENAALRYLGAIASGYRHEYPLFWPGVACAVIAVALFAILRTAKPRE
jgi:4-amino-4-deoxy-L-arabinose transferase-like glycosyltransferase